MGRSRGLRTAALLLGLCLSGCLRLPEPEDPNRFARLAASGEPAQQDEPHRCVLDRRSSLTWVVPRPGDALLDPAHRYTWYSEDAAQHLGHPGMRDGGRCGAARCDTAALVEAINAQGLCGHRDWRLPSREESIALGKRHAGHPIGLHPALFPGLGPGEVWTATTFRMYAQSAWALDPGNGLDRVDLKTEAKAVRLVRGTMTLRRRNG
jgi:hypothetical protein